jgi:hypothetical protein
MEQLRNIVEEWAYETLNEQHITPILQINENHVGTKFHIATNKDVTLLRGVTGCGKSQVCAFLVRQFVLESEDLFFKRIKNDKPFKVYVFDTEMSDLNIKKYFLKDAFHEYSKKEIISNLKVTESLYVLYLKEYSMEDRMGQLLNKAKEIKKEAQAYNNIIFIDNIGSFCEDINSGSTNKLVNNIFAALSEFTTFVVMHTNHKENSQTKSNATGLIGSVVERLSQNIVEIQKSESKLITMQLKKSKTQDDKLDYAVNFIQEEAEGKFFIKDVVPSDNLDIDKNKTKNSSRVSDEEFLQRIRDHVKDKPNNSPERTRKNLKSRFPEYSDTSKSVDNKITEFVNKEILIDVGGYIFHKDEMPFP